ncbi:MAG: hypothetical protein WDM86_06515 [Rhizomicrobium sp.]
MTNKSVPSDRARKQAAKRYFDAKRVKRASGGLLYRSVVDVHTKSSLKDLKDEAQDRGFHVLRIDKSYVIICGKPEIEVIC